MTPIPESLAAMVKKEAENHVMSYTRRHNPFLFNHKVESFEAGALFMYEKVPELLLDFFVWFRDKGGESNIGISIEKMIDKYLNQKL